MDTLKADISEHRVIAVREGENLLGFLRFGREKKVSVLWQIVVAPAGRGKGIGTALVKDWIALEREEVAKFQLWVREDNPPALKMYEALGFLPDGRIAPVMLKK
jgi:ribosomal protein S18 acetylase RimI-like enzyme